MIALYELLTPPSALVHEGVSVYVLAHALSLEVPSF